MLLGVAYPFSIYSQWSLREYQGQANNPPRIIPSPDGLIRRLFSFKEE